MLTREEMRFYSAGVYYYQNRSESFDIKRIETYVDGALMAFDLLNKKNKSIEEKKIDIKQIDIPKIELNKTN